MMEQVTTDAGFSVRKPLYSFKTSHHNNNSMEDKTVEDSMVKATSELTLRRNKPVMRKPQDAGNTRRPRHRSAPDLSFGGAVDITQLDRFKQENQRDFNEKPLKTAVRRPSLGSELELIDEEENVSDQETEEDKCSQDVMSSSERLLARPMRLPPIFENQGYKPQKRDFTQRPGGDNFIGISDAVQHRYIRGRPSNRRRKLSM